LIFSLPRSPEEAKRQLNSPESEKKNNTKRFATFDVNSSPGEISRALAVYYTIGEMGNIEIFNCEPTSCLFGDIRPKREKNRRWE